VVTMQVFVRGDCTMIAAPVQCDVDGVPKGSHFARVPPMGYTGDGAAVGRRGSGGGPSPAYWPLGSPAGRWCRQGRSDRLPGTTTRRPRSVAGWGRAFDACCFAGKLRSHGGLGRRATVAQARTPTLDPTRNPTPATRVPLASWVRCSRWVWPSWGSGAAAPGGALRAIDSSARPRLLAALRPAPPSAAISA
jgi:hypothetical protein